MRCCRQRPAKSHDGAKAGGLSGAVAADQTDEFAGADLECHAAQHAAALDIDREVSHGEHQWARRLPTTASTRAASAKNRSGGRSAKHLAPGQGDDAARIGGDQIHVVLDQHDRLDAGLRPAAMRISMISCLSAVETPDVGSSSRITSGSSANAEATSSSFFSPWDSAAAAVSSRRSRPKMRATSRARLRIVASAARRENKRQRLLWREMTAAAMVSSTVSCGKIAMS